jgi:hypothetical protein
VVGRLLRHRRASPSAALDKAIRLIIDTQASAESQPPDHPVSPPVSLPVNLPVGTPRGWFSFTQVP